MKKKLGIFTVARSDFGILKTIIQKLGYDKNFDTYLIIGGAHNSNIFGETKKEIKLKNVKLVNFKINYNKSSEKNIINYFNLNLSASAKIIQKLNLDAAIILGDRYEMMAISISCINNKVKILHFSGGSITEGSLDNIYRYCISKMSFAHFLETEEHKKNLIKSDIKKNLFIIGAPSLENSKKNLISKERFEKKYNFEFQKNKKILLATFHPETTKSIYQNNKYLRIFLNFLKKVNQNVIITYPNADTGFKNYINLIKKFSLNNKNFLVVPHLGRINYLSALKFSDLLLGNSSSGITESATFKIPCIDVGDRQKNRTRNSNVLNADFNFKSLHSNYKKALSAKFTKRCKSIKNIYFKNNISASFIKIIKKILK